MKVQAEIDGGALPDFPTETADIRAKEWTVAPIPKDLEDRRVEITGPVDRKMIINALNSGANVFMADFEDSNSPTWQNNIEGQINLRDAIDGTHRVHQPRRQEVRAGGEDRGAAGAAARLAPGGEALPGGWRADFGRRCSISGCIFFHNAKNLMAKGTGPYFYLPKMESHLEARLWNDVFVFAQDYVGVPQGSIRATVLIETILGAFRDG